MSRFAPHFRLAAKQALRPRVMAARPFHTSMMHRNVAPVMRSDILPDFSLKGKVIVVSGGARGLGLIQTEALLEAGATGMLAAHVVSEDHR